MITLFNTINSISTSVTARIKQYGAMRAVGMDGNQFTRMIAEEAFTYSISGFVIGGVIGIALTWYFGTLWSMPVELLAIVIVFSFVTAIAVAYAPAKHIQYGNYRNNQ